MLIDEKISNILFIIKNNKRNVGYTNLLKDPSISVNQTIKIVKYLWETDLVSVENKGRKKVVHLTEEGLEVFSLITQINKIIK